MSEEKIAMFIDSCRNEKLMGFDFHVEDMPNTYGTDLQSTYKEVDSPKDRCSELDNLPFTEAYDAVLACLKQRFMKVHSYDLKRLNEQKELGNIYDLATIMDVFYFSDPNVFDTVIDEVSQEEVKKENLNNFDLKAFIVKKRKLGQLENKRLFKEIVFMLVLSKKLNSLNYLTEARYLLQVVCNHRTLYLGRVFPSHTEKQKKLSLKRSKQGQTRTRNNLLPALEALCAFIFLYRPDNGWESVAEMERVINPKMAEYIKESGIGVTTVSNIERRIKESSRENVAISNAYEITKHDAHIYHPNTSLYNRCASRLLSEGVDFLYLEAMHSRIGTDDIGIPDDDCFLNCEQLEQDEGGSSFLLITSDAISDPESDHLLKFEIHPSGYEIDDMNFPDDMEESEVNNVKYVINRLKRDGLINFISKLSQEQIKLLFEPQNLPKRDGLDMNESIPSTMQDYAKGGYFFHF